MMIVKSFSTHAHGMSSALIRARLRMQGSTVNVIIYYNINRNTIIYHNILEHTTSTIYYNILPYTIYCQHYNIL